jgi:hypothetical protein
MAFIAGRDRRVAVFILEPEWPGFAALVGADTAGSMAVDLAAFTAVEVGSTAVAEEGMGGKLEMTLRPVEATT